MTTASTSDPHFDMHSGQGGLRGEHPGRSSSPVIKVDDLAWLEFEKPDLARALTFAQDFGFTVHEQTPDALYLRGTWSGTPCLVVRRGPTSRFVGPAFRAADTADLDRLASHIGGDITMADEVIGGHSLTVRDPSGLPVRVVSGGTELPVLADQDAPTFNTGTTRARLNATQRPAREPARVQRLGHVVLMSTRFQRDLDWYLGTFGLIVSDFLFIEGQRDRGPSMAFIRCDRGTVPSDHHTLAMTIGPTPGYVHSAYQVNDLDSLAAGGSYLEERGYSRAWGVGRHILGSQIFDYWRDPDRLMMEHFTDGDLFDNSAETGWSPMSAANLYQWGPPVTKDFLDTTPTPHLIKSVVAALRDDNELDLPRLLALLKAMTP